MIKNLTEKQTKKVTLNFHVELPQDNYILRVMDETFELSKNTNNPMVVRKFEFVTEAALAPDGSQIVLAGTEITQWYALRSNGTKKNSPEDATAMLLDKFKNDTILMGAPDINWATFDDEKPPLVCKGLCFNAICASQKQVERKPKKPGQKVGDPILGTDKKPVVIFKPFIKTILEPSTTQVAAPY